MITHSKTGLTARLAKNALKSCGLLEPIKRVRDVIVGKQGNALTYDEKMILPEIADMYGKLSGRTVDAGPCRVSRKRYEWIDQIKYKRDLTRLESMDYLSYMFFQNFGYNIDFQNPITFNEKLNWLKVFHHDPMAHIVADKARCPDVLHTYFPDKSNHIIKPLAIFKSADELTEDILLSLPERFIIKSNFGSGAQEFVEKKTTNIQHLRHLISSWCNPHANQYYNFLEYSYKDIPARVICEPIVTFDCKIEIFSFGGEPVFYWMVINDKTNDTRANLYEMDGTKIPVQWHYDNFAEEIPQPGYFNELVEITKRLSSPFPHVRVDFYAARDDWYFSELTFYTWAGISPFSDYSFDVKIGKKIYLELKEA